MGRKTRAVFQKYRPLLEMIGIAALNGAATGLWGQIVLPDFTWKTDVVVGAVMLSMGKAILNVLIENPFKTGRRDRRARPRGKGRV